VPAAVADADGDTANDTPTADGGERHWASTGDVIVRPAAAGVPPVFVVRPEAGPGPDWVRADIDYALAQAEASPLGPDAIPTRLPEMLLVEVRRLHLATAPAVDSGLVAALHDRVLNPALAALHAAPAHKWTVPELARVAAVSFKRTYGTPPGAWRATHRLR